MVGFNRRFDPNFAALQKRIADGAIGEVEIVSIISRDPGPPPISYIARSGGLFRDMMIHDFDMARFLLGEEPVAVSAMGSALVDKAIGEAGDVDTAVVIMETKSGKVAQISNSRRADLWLRSAHRGAWLEGHVARRQYPRDDGRVRRRAGLRQRQGRSTSSWSATPSAYRDELDAFVKAVSRGRKPRPDGEDGLRANLLADAANLSWRTRQRVTLG